MAVRPALLSLLPLLAVSGGLRAQASPVVQPDSIYGLRVDPSAHPGHDYVLLLSDGAVRLDADGRTSYTLRQVAQILTTDGAESWGEFAVWYVPDRQRVRINWIRVIGADGRVVRDGPEHQQETSPTVAQGAPVYSDRRAVQATLGGVTPGTLVDYSYTLETVRPHLPGDFRYYWGVNGDAPVRRSRFILDVPSDVDPRVRTANIWRPADDRVVAGRRVRTWAFIELAAVEWESFAGAPNDVIQAVAVGGTVSWSDIGAWYRALAAGRDALTPEILAAHRAELAGAATLDDSLRRTYRWVAQDFRYVSLALGDGGYQPRRPADVFGTRFGDCKDKTTLFVSLARRMGVDAYPVLVHSEGGVDAELPSIRQFDHMIAGITRGGRTEYADVTSTLTPYGELPPALQDEVGLAVGEGGARLVVLPAVPIERNRYDREVVGALGLDGRFVGRVTLQSLGTEQYGLREAFSDIHRQDAKARDATLRGYAQGVYSTATVDSARYSDGRDLAAPPSVTVWFTATNVLGRLGPKYYFNVPLLTFTDPSTLSRLEAEGNRRFPIDVAQVNSPSVWRSTFEIELPASWKAEVPAAISVGGPFGYYRVQYAQAGRTLRASREMGGRRGLEPPDSAAALRAWFRGVGEDATKMIVLNRGGGRDLADSAAPDAVPGAIGKLPDVVVGLDDLPVGARVSSERAGGEREASFLAMGSADPIELYKREFDAEQLVFTVGGSRLLGLEAMAAAYHSPAEARRPLGLLGLFDLREFLNLFLEGTGVDQASLGAARAIDLGGIGDQASGWVLELVTPFATLDMALMVAARGRVGFTLVGVGPQGLQDGDLTGLFRRMDRRVQEHEGYLTEVPAGPEGQDAVAKVDSALRVHTDIALNEVVARSPDLAGSTVRTADFGLNNGWPQYTLTVQGRGLTFPLAGGPAITLSMDVMLHDTEAQALKRVLYAESRDREYLVGSLLSDTGTMTRRIAGDAANTVEPGAGPPLGARSVGITARLRTVMRTDIDAVFFASGRVSAAVKVWRLSGAGEAGAAAGLARDLRRRLRRVVPAASDAPPAQRLITAVRRVVEAERAVDSLVDARAFDAAFATIARARLAEAPVGFWTATWHRVCRLGSLHGDARRAREACEAAVAPDTTILTYRDSRGVGRALAGDLKGAAEDFAYVVAHAAAGAYLDKRAAWLDALRAGTNPFTERVLEELRRP